GTYSETRTWHATDACGNTSGTVTQTITVKDTTPPFISNAGADATIDCPASPTFTAPTASDSCNSATVTQVGQDTTANGTCAGAFSEARAWHATDACGNTSGTVTQTITVRDNTPPFISNAGADATIDCPASPTFTAPTASDSCNSATVTQVGQDTTANGTCAGAFSEARAWHATDACGNTSGTVTQTITVRDNTPPFISDAGANATIDCPASPTFTAPTASDSCNSATVTQVGQDSTANGTCAGTYSETRTWIATDACGNTSGTVTQTITVKDTTPPFISAAGADATIDCPASPTFTAPTASDSCNSATVTQVGQDSTANGTCAGTYSETRTWIATDACGNTSGTVSQTITVKDTTPPFISAAGADATIDCPASPTFTAPTASDSCNSATVTQVGQDSTANGTCAGTYSETRTWIATDACGNTSGTVTQTITVRD